MPVINRVADLSDEAAVWRRDFHEHPELQFDVHRTAGIVADKLREFGVDEIATGIGRTGVVAVIKGRGQASGKVVGMRADMDALPMTEETGLAHASKTPGKMHACGHDGHTAMLLGAAKYLAETRNFDGTAVLIFQPAEEGGGGAREMVEAGMMERFGIQEVYGMHNHPGLEVGKFSIRPGPLLAAADMFEIKITGKGSHAARPHESVDPVIIAAQIIMALQTIASRNVDPLESVVVSTCMVEAGTAFNIIPPVVTLSGTVRTLSEAVRALTIKRMDEIARSTAAAHGGSAVLNFGFGAPVTMNNPEKTVFAVKVARDVAGDANVIDDRPPIMGGEDFSFMLNKRPGSFIFIGNGMSAGVHHPEYDFNDQAIPFGISYWARLVETAMPR